jgi:hypothetical protein
MVHNMNKNTYLFDTFLAVPMRLQVLYPDNLLIEKNNYCQTTSIITLIILDINPNVIQ